MDEQSAQELPLGVTLLFDFTLGGRVSRGGGGLRVVVVWTTGTSATTNTLCHFHFGLWLGSLWQRSRSSLQRVTLLQVLGQGHTTLQDTAPLTTSEATTTAEQSNSYGTTCSIQAQTYFFYTIILYNGKAWMTNIGFFVLFVSHSPQFGRRLEWRSGGEGQLKVMGLLKVILSLSRFIVLRGHEAYICIYIKTAKQAYLQGTQAALVDWQQI